MQQSDNISPQAPSLPKGGGALTGLSGQAGPPGRTARRRCLCRCPSVPDAAMPFSLTQLQQSGR